jgi:hypothetical protein
VTLPVSFYLDHYPGVGRWLQTLEQTGYARGADLVEADYLLGVGDARATADAALLALEADGRIRRGGFAPSRSRLAFVGSFGETRGGL